MSTTDHLALAKEDLEIAESGNAKREAYIRAATHLAAYRDESPRKWREEAASYCNTKVATIDKLVKWHGTGFKAETPFLMDEKATTRAAKSHAKAVLKNPEQRKAAIEEIAKDDPKAITEIAKDAIGATADDDVATDLATTAFDRSAEIRQKGRKYKTKAKTTGGFEGWLKVSGRIDSAKFQAKQALKEIQGIDTPIAEDLREELRRDLDLLDGAWALVRASVEGETVGDQAEEFLASLAEND